MAGREDVNSDWYEVSARGHHGYPQPEDDYQRMTYDNWCPRCGAHGRQRGPFRVRHSTRAAHSHFLQPNWEFDVLFVDAHLAA